MKKTEVTQIIGNTWVKPYLQQNKKLLWLTVVLGVMTFFAAAALMFTSGYLISKSATRPYNILMVYVPIVLVRAFGISRPVFKYLERMTSHNFVLKILSKMRVRLFKNLETQAVTLKSRFTTGNLLGVLADDLEHIQDLYLRSIFPSVTALVLYILIIIALGFFSIPFALLMLLLLFVLVILVPLVSLLVNRKRLLEMKEVRNGLYQTLTDAVMGVSDWKMSGRQGDFLKSYEAQEQAQDEIEHRMEQFNRWRNFSFQVLVGILTLLMIWFASFNVEAETFGAVWIAAFVLVVFPLAEAFAPVSEALSHIPNYSNSLKRLNTIEATSGESEESDGTVLAHLKAASSLTLKMKDVSFSYHGADNRVLTKIHVTFQPGEKVAILGKSGSGKSTMAKLLLGAEVPSSGSVTMNEVEVSTIREDMSAFVAVLQQKPHLFNTTVMNNIRLGNTKASDEEVIEAAKQVQMHDYIMSLPNGYQTSMHELGERFSGGERQRIALARILLQKTPIVLLDEPTVGLDPITERRLLETIFDSLHDKTVIWITHHLVGVEQVDRILFIEQGDIEMEGSHFELLASQERYANLYNLDCPISN